MIYIVQRELPHYRIPFFLELSKLYNIKVLVARYDSEKTKYISGLNDQIFKKVKGWFPIKSNPYISVLFTTIIIIKNKPDIIIHEMSLSNLNCYFLPVLSKILRIKFAFWGHGYHKNDKYGKKNKFKRTIRIFLHKFADANIVYSAKGGQFLIKYGIDNHKVFTAWNTLETKDIFASNGDSSVKNRSNSISFLFLGRLIPDKFPLLVVLMFNELKKINKNCILHFIGKGPEDEKIKLFIGNSKTKDVFIHGEITDNAELSGILSECDILVNPGYLGLNIVHALAFGIPIVSVNDGIDGISHSPEFEYIENTPAFLGIQKLDVESFVEACSIFIKNKTHLNKAKITAQGIYKNISMDNMVKGFQDTINYINSNLSG